HLIGGRTGDAKSNIARHPGYDPATDKRSDAAPMPTARSSVAFAHYHGLLFVAGGECRMDNKAYDEGEALAVKNNRWVSFAVLPTTRHAFGAAVVDDKLLFVGGSIPCAGNGKVADMLQLTLK